MRVLGIDPGSRVTGFGIVQYQDKTPRYVASGVVRLTEKPLEIRLKQIFTDLSDIILSYKPDVAAIEQVFVHKNPNSALTLGHARGAAILAVMMQNLSISEYSARQIKQAVVGYGNADKSQVQHMVKALLTLPEEPKADAADGLAVALCHGQCAINGIGKHMAERYRHGRMT